MNKRRAALLALSVIFLFGASVTFAHHGTANFDTTKSVTVKGTVSNFQFINPHVIISLDVKDDKGTVVTWAGALTSPNHLMRSGWTKETLKNGDVITLSGFPAKTGAPEVWIQKVVLENGTALDTSGGN
jgi:DNA/RNA endonuclease YhcR with UshA esterase domain